MRLPPAQTAHSPHCRRAGQDVPGYAAPAAGKNRPYVTNDALGYVVTDNNFAFMGHIIGEEIADEVLSVGKHMGSFVVEEYYAMLKDMK